ncbi:MAG: hypothetical protein KAS70_07870 [Planctomycetes bacterium]|nr:hypothetical protein [Planctomycetota bacterium]MCK5579146.1 hypothetical protein [Planctomycetota bacterium]
MPYDKSLDESLFSQNWEGERDRLTVSIFSYNKGAKKMQITREKKDAQGDLKFAKMGRLNKEELEAILPFIQEALNQM